MIVKPDTSRYGTDTLDLSEQIGQAFQLGMHHRKKREAETQRQNTLDAGKAYLADPSNQQKMLEVYSHNPEMAKGLLGLIASQDQQELLKQAQNAEYSQQFFGNVETMIKNGESPQAIRRTIAGAVDEFQKRGHDIGILKEMVSKPLDEIAAIATSQSVLAGNVVKALPVMTPYQQEQINLGRQKLSLDRSKLELEKSKPVSKGVGVGKISPKDYTAKSIAKYQQSGDLNDLVRYRSGSEKRAQASIDRGYDAARGLPVINRSIALLDSVSTGGFSQAALKFKQATGIESADEAELSANLGKAVLSQLKDTFGTQFTEQEGARLERIEAGFGKSTEGNRRLLNQLKRMSDAKVKQALTRAEQIGDTATIDEINSYLNLDLSDDLGLTSGEVLSNSQQGNTNDELLSKYGIK